MAYSIEFEKEASQSFKKLDNSIKKQIIKFLKKLEEREDPRSLGQQLKENLSCFWKYRVDDYRIIAEIQDDKLIILVLFLAKRSDVYKLAQKKYH